MNIELIKKYKTEFDHFLNEGDLLCREINIKVPTDWYEFDNDWSWSVDELEIIINDEYSHLRKALCEGKTLEFKDPFKYEIPRWEKLNTKDPSYSFYYKNEYRIKPKESEFKSGDFVRNIHRNTIHIVDRVIPMDDIRSNIHVTPGGAYFDNELIKWDSQAGELCWFWSGNKLEEATLSKFHSYTKHGGFKTIYDSYNHCEPFLNSKPSWFK